MWDLYTFLDACNFNNQNYNFHYKKMILYYIYMTNHHIEMKVFCYLNRQFYNSLFSGEKRSEKHIFTYSITVSHWALNLTIMSFEI